MADARKRQDMSRALRRHYTQSISGYATQAPVNALGLLNRTLGRSPNEVVVPIRP